MLGERTSTTSGDGGAAARSPPEVFELLADETRFEILRVLRDRQGGPLRYSEIRRAANVEDSSRFNYHLSRLTGTLVTDVDDGYRLRPDTERLLDLVFGTKENDYTSQLST